MPFRRQISTALLVGPLLGLSSQLCHAQTWDAVSQFSYSNNPNGVWSYGVEPPTSGSNPPVFVILTSSFNSNGFAGWYTPTGAGDIAVNLSGSTQYGVAPGQLTMQPDNNDNADVVRWTSPMTGTINIDGQFYPGDQGIMDVAVLLDGHELFSASDSGSFNETVAVQTGDTVDFTVTEGPEGYGYGNTPLAATITVVPEPASAMLMAIASVGLLRRRGRLSRR